MPRTQTGPASGARRVTTMELAEIITCPDCGGRAHLVQPPAPDEVLEAGDVLVYRCEDCLDRWDVVMDEEDVGAPEGDPR